MNMSPARLNDSGKEVIEFDTTYFYTVEEEFDPVLPRYSLMKCDPNYNSVPEQQTQYCSGIRKRLHTMRLT